MDTYLQWLNGLFKNTDITQAIALAYITGIFPVIRQEFQSKLNNFTEYSMLEPDNLAEYFGFTSNEVQSLCNKYNVSMDECKRWYDGYRLGEYEIYAPLSVVKAVTRKKFMSYWNATSSSSAFSRYIDFNYDGIKEDINTLVAGGNVEVNVGKFENKIDFKSKDDVFTYCIHLGYLSYDDETKTCHIPNYEVRQEWLNYMSDTPAYKNSWQIIKNSQSLLEATIAGDENRVAELIEQAHDMLASSLSYNREQVLQVVIMMAYLYAREEYTVIQELPAGKGFADVAFVPYYPDKNKPVIIVELKLDKSTESGLKQIKNRNYPAGLEKYKDNMLLVAISYDSKTKKHKCDEIQI